MDKISFKNFRRFFDFTPIEYSGITFLVGRNNSGKSTVVKALLLIVDYLKSDDITIFSFNQRNIEDANVSTYGRAKYKLAKEDFISFSLNKDSFSFRIIVSGNPNNTFANVIEFEVSDFKTGLIFNFSPVQSSVSISNNTNISSTQSEEDQLFLQNLTEQEKALIIKLNSIKLKTSPEFIYLNEDLSNVRKRIKTIKNSIKREQTQGTFNLQAHYKNTNFSDILTEAITEFSAEWDMQYHSVQKGNKPKSSFESFKAFKDSKFIIERSVNEVFLFTKQLENIYLGASYNKQSALFSIRDKNNALAQAVHEFKQLGIDNLKNERAYQFVLEWMKEDKFDLGDSFEIVMHAGEAYEMVIISDGLEIHLADKGMGSIQLMLLLIRLATIIHKKQKNGKNYTVVIEEPELNLHPGFQSKLAALFYQVNQSFDINFIVETHSEYLIRKTQVIVKEKNIIDRNHENPFTVIYFDSNSNQWKMNYREDGKFIEEFGSGFFDETRKLVKKIL